MKTLEHRAIAQYFNTLLGDKFYVDINSCEYPKKDKINCALQLTRTPFPIDGVDCESLNASLNVLADINNDYNKDTVMNALTALCGYKAGEIDTAIYNSAGGQVSTETWYVKSFLDFQKSLTTPMLDDGSTLDVFIVSGTILCSNSVTGALMSNDVKTELWVSDPAEDNPEEDDEPINGTMMDITTQSKITKVTEGTQKGNQPIPKPNVLSQYVTFAIQALYLNRAIDGDIWAAIENAATLEKIYYVKRTIGSTSYTKKCMLIDGTITGQAGTYLLYTLTLQETI